MSWPKLPRMNPCLPCLVGNPLTPRERTRLQGSIEQLEGLKTSGDCMTRGYIGGLKSCEQRFNPAVSVAQQQLFGAALALKRGEVEASQVSGPARHLAATLSEKKLRDFAATPHGGLPARANPKKKGCTHIDMPYSHAHIDMPHAHSAGRDSVEVAPHGEVGLNPRGAGPWVVWHKGCARVRNGKDQEKSLLAAGYNRVATVKSHAEADALADEQYGGRMNPDMLSFGAGTALGYAAGSGILTAGGRLAAKKIEERAKNPKLLVLNPASDAFVAKVERILKRTLSAEERAQLGTARKEYRAFHGRDPDSLVPVEVPKGTPRFVNYVGDTDRLDYTVRADSERKGKWTHKAGDHGRSSKETKPALLVSVPGKKAPPIFAQRSDSDMYFKPTHGVMG